jgi:hypothetical protein
MSEQKGVKWSVCKVMGSVTAVNSGFLSSDSSTRLYERKSVKVGLNLTAYNEDLPTVTVAAVGDDFIKVRVPNSLVTIYTGEFYRSPRKGLSYVYSDVCIKLLE